MDTRSPRQIRNQDTPATREMIISPEARASRDATAASQVAAQAAIDATQKQFPIGNYNTSPEHGEPQ
jgi:hypothetical protein